MTALPLPTGTATTSAPRRRVVDVPTRVFHALFALSFFGAYLTAEGERWRAMHVTLGYTLAGLLAFRVLYGLFGPRHARLGALLRKLAGAPAWGRSTLHALKAGQWQALLARPGQHLLLAASVAALLVLAGPLALSGYATYNDWGDAFEEVHEFFGNAMLAVVLGHLALVAAWSLSRRQNLAAPMLSGTVAGPGPDVVKKPHRSLALLLVLAVLAFGVWRWQLAPQGLVPAWGAAGAAHTQPGGDDDDD
ncbi:cytochrome b/b6 domain-containing protein [Rubrivivax rivuli]|uniref:Cytochrome b/b6 domain-containing protein n=1 Tax=Rubrivivax rivuli TaxID=1862385 RepID=A0A437RE38_9BURK|nr:cytochrome b/b6 domain-containing protein [Rubrivivax rivuli]RVU45003.1 cytochrome b/b6 domain-containing protein [Rubrivivax rivuli]